MAVSRIRLRDLQYSDFPAAIGACSGDVSTVARAANRCQERLITCGEAGDHGWYGSYAELAFNVSPTTPCITLPRGVARLISVDACTYPIPVQNQFYEYLQLGDGRQPKCCSSDSSVCVCGQTMALRRNVACTFSPLTTPGYGLRFTSSEAGDDGKRVMVSCYDAYGQLVQTLDSSDSVRGVFTTLAAPFADMKLPGINTNLEISAITGIQKDITLGTVSIYEVNLITGAQTLILQMEPGETVAAYPVYYFSNLPDNCCAAVGETDSVQVTAMVKLDLVPVTVPTDYLLIQSIEALICEAKSMRLGDSDVSNAKAQGILEHRQAIRYLQGELAHREGTDRPAISFAPFGHARLANLKIGTLT